MVELICAIAHKKTGFVTDARNPYDWEEVGRIILSDNCTPTDVLKERAIAGIPDEALIVAARSLT